MKVCIGGTFNILHKGHKKLLDKAFEVAGEKGFVFIGLSNDELSKRKTNKIKLNVRKKNLENYLLKKGFNDKSVIIPITTKYGLTIEEDYEAIVVSPETYKVAEEINKKRLSIGKKPLEIVKIPFVLAEDGKPISSSRIINKEIDEEGKLL